METMLERFFAKVEADPNGGCWLWSGAKSGPMDYGYFRMGSMTKAHRASWVIHKGEIPKGLCVLHKCDVPRCVNPDHLWLGTYAQNNADRDAKGRYRHGTSRSIRSFGEKANRAKLSNEAVLEIRRSTEPRRVLAKKYAVRKETITRIRLGQARTKDHLGRAMIQSILSEEG